MSRLVFSFVALVILSMPVADRVRAADDLPAKSEGLGSRVESDRASAAGDLLLEERVAALETRLKSVRAQLGKLDFIFEQLTAVRNQDLPKLHRDLRRLSEASVRSEGSSETQGNGGAVTEKEVQEDDPGGSIEQQLKKLDDIAELLSELRGEDLPKLLRDVHGMHEGSGRVANKPSADGGVPLRRRGVVVVNNATDTHYRVTINGVVRQVAPGRTKIEVAYGPLTTQLTDFEDPRTWEVSYWEKVDGKDQMVLNLK